MEVHWVVEEQLTKQMLRQAREACMPVYSEFAKCSEGKLVSLLWDCKHQNEAYKQCLQQHASEAELERRKREWVRFSLENPVSEKSQVLPDPSKFGRNKTQEPI